MEKPDRTVWITVSYDERGRARKVTLQDGASKEFRYEGLDAKP